MKNIITFAYTPAGNPARGMELSPGKALRACTAGGPSPLVPKKLNFYILSDLRVKLQAGNFAAPLTAYHIDNLLFTRNRRAAVNLTKIINIINKISKIAKNGGVISNYFRIFSNYFQEISNYFQLISKSNPILKIRCGWPIVNYTFLNHSYGK